MSRTSVTSVLVSSAFFLSLFASTEVAHADDACAPRIDLPASRKLFATASCHEVQNKTASAWAEFLDAAALAKRDRDTSIEELANQRAIAVERRLSRVIVRVEHNPDPHSPTPDVRLDGILLGRGAWDSPLPVDPGVHKIDVVFPSGARAQESVTIRGNGDLQTVRITLANAEVASTTTLSAAVIENNVLDPSLVPEAPSSEGRGTVQRVLGLVLAGAGAAGIGMGTYLSIDRERQTPAATWSFAGGGAGLALGALLFFTAPSPKRPFATAFVSPCDASVGLAGAF